MAWHLSAQQTDYLIKNSSMALLWFDREQQQLSLNSSAEHCLTLGLTSPDNVSLALLQQHWQALLSAPTIATFLMQGDVGDTLPILHIQSQRRCSLQLTAQDAGGCLLLLTDADNEQSDKAHPTQQFDRALSEISTQLIRCSAEQVDQHIVAALEAFAQCSYSDRCYVFLFDDDGEVINNSHEWAAVGVSRHAHELKGLQESDLPWFFQCLREQQQMVLNHIDSLPRAAQAEHDEFKREQIRSILCVGIFASDRMIGFVGADAVKQQRDWTHDDIRRLRLVGNVIFNTLQRHWDQQALDTAREHMQALNQRLQRQAHQDGLTGLANRRALDRCLLLELRRAARQQQALSLLLIDIDYFKAYNDYFGHLHGDQALKTVARVLQEHAQRSGDMVSRYGGEEFVIVLPATDQQQAEQLGQRLLANLRAEQIAHPASPTAQVLTISIGAHSITPEAKSAPQQLATRLLKAADDALYYAKKQGRDRYCCSRSISY